MEIWKREERNENLEMRTRARDRSGSDRREEKADSPTPPDPNYALWAKPNYSFSRRGCTPINKTVKFFFLYFGTNCKKLKKIAQNYRAGKLGFL